MNQRKRPSGFVQAVKKFFLSAFVVVTFIAYALENRGAKALTGGTATPPPAGPAPTSENGFANGQAATSAPAASQPAEQPTTQPVVPFTGGGDDDNPPPQPANPPAAPTNAPAPTQQAANNPAPTAQPAQAAGQFKDGTYTGPSVWVNWGYVQVQAQVQGGKLANVQFLQFPQDRRTSQRINSFAVPTLQQEAIQAQSANVDLVTGATLTSEGFQMSLQSALSQAGNVQ